MTGRRLLGAGLRAGIVFLLLAWVVTRPGMQGFLPLDSWGIAKCALVGLPLAALVAALITLRRGTRGGWRRGAVASAVALVVPAAILATSGGHAPGTMDGRADEARADEPRAEALTTSFEEADSGGRAYRLRVRGLHPLIEEAQGGRARVEIGARMDEAGSGFVIIEAQLLDEASGRTLWQKAYRGEGSTPSDIRKIVAEALREAMSLTREGAGREGRTI